MLEVGRIGRPHGLRGAVFVELTSDREERLAPGAHLWARGLDLVVRHRRRATNGRAIVEFEPLTDRSDAARLTNAVLYGEPIDDPAALWVHELIGRHVVDQHGSDHGPCVAVVANPAADLLELASGALVPSNFVVGLAGPVIEVEVPDGLFDESAAG